MCEWLDEEIAGKIVIIGIGNEIRNDDIAGLKIIEKLQGKLPERIKLINCGQVPENYSKEIIEFDPDNIIIFDVVDFKGVPGEIKKIETDSIEGFSFSTHNYDLSLFIKYIHNFIKTEFFIIGIQPKSISLGEELSYEVKKSVEKIVSTILKKFKQPGPENI
ncbi:hydrogenase maturation peptidase HycI [candidate division KSB1 bacterium]